MRVNHRIRVSPVRLIGSDGEQLGIVPVKEALDRAAEFDLDLVEVSPNSRPPVCRILDYGKFKYEQAKKEKLSKKKQHSFQMKEMRYRPKIDEHDYQFKLKHVLAFLKSGSKVRTYVMFRGREMAYTDRGRKLLHRVAEDLVEIAVIDMSPKQEGRHMSMILSPKPEIMKQLKTTAANRADEKADKSNRKEQPSETESEQEQEQEREIETKPDEQVEN